MECVRTLLQRVWIDIAGGEYVDVLQPIRKPRSKLILAEHLERAVDFAVKKLQAAKPKLEGEVVLLMLDADRDPGCVLGPKLLEFMRRARADVDMACVLPTLEYETWFVGAAESLQAFIDVPLNVPEHPCGFRKFCRRRSGNSGRLILQLS